MCRYCLMKTTSGESIEGEGASCQRFFSDNGNYCDNDAKFLVRTHQSLLHLCNLHYEQQRMELATGLDKYLEMDGMDGSPSFFKIKSDNICDHMDFDTGDCENKARWVSYGKIDTCFCEDHAIEAGYCPS